MKAVFIETERGSTRLHFVENLLSKRLWTCRKEEYSMNEWMNEYSFHIYAIWLLCSGSTLRARIQKEAWSLEIGAVVAWHEQDDWCQ